MARVMQSPLVVQNDFSPPLHVTKSLFLLGLLSVMLLNYGTDFISRKKSVSEPTKNQTGVQNSLKDCGRLPARRAFH